MGEGYQGARHGFVVGSTASPRPHAEAIARIEFPEIVFGDRAIKEETRYKGGGGAVLG